MSTTDPIGRVRVEPGIWQRGDKYEITYRDAGGKQRRRVIDGGIMAARSALATEVARRATGERAPADPRLTFGKAADRWYDDHVMAHLRPASQSAARSALKHLRAEFGSRRLTAIQAADVSRYVTSKRTAGLADNTVRSHVNCLSGVYRHAVRHLGSTATSPCAALDRRERPTTEPVTEGRALTSDEVARLCTATLSADALLTELTLATGLRMSEALGLVWDDLDLTDTPALNVTMQLSRYGERGVRVSVKSKRGKRRVVITRDLARKMVAARLLAARSGEGHYVFTSRVGAPREQRVMCRTFRATVTRAGLDEAMVWHWLRHTHASQLIAAGWDVAAVAARLGDSIATVVATYAHLFDAARREDEQREQLAALAADGSIVAAPAGTTRTLRAVAGGSETA